MPAATSIADIVKPMTSAVPRSGWEAMSSAAAPATSSSGLITPLSVCSRLGLPASSPAAYSTSDSFMISLGWNCSGPAPIQRRAPLTSTPMPGIFTATSSPKEIDEHDRREALRQLEAAPRHDLHEHAARTPRT